MENLKLVMVGDSFVGKTSLLERLVYNKYSPQVKSTLGIDFGVKVMDIDGVKIKLQIWDTAGQEKFRTVTKAYYRGAAGILMVFDLTSAKSLYSLNQWLEECSEDESVIFMIIGNKKDAEKHEVTPEMVKAFCEKISRECIYIETSAKENIDVEEAFRQMAKRVMEIIMISKQNQAPDPELLKLEEKTSDHSTTTCFSDSLCQN